MTHPISLIEQPPKMWFVRYSDADILGPLSTTDVRQALARSEIHFQHELGNSPSGPWAPAYKQPDFEDCIALQSA